MDNLLEFKAMICTETIRNKRQLGKALRKVEELALIALRTGRVIGINLKELKKPRITKTKNRKALGLSGLCAGE